MISYCGFDCDNCPLKMVTKYNDENLKKEIMATYGLEPNMTCEGCTSDKCCDYCSKCNIRSCNINNKLQNCGQCTKYLSCKDILFVVNTNIQSKNILDEIYKNLCKKN